MPQVNTVSNIELDKRLVRFNEMIACKTAFIDARTPGSDKKENFCLIGEGVAENPGQVIHIDVAHGFNVGAARQPKGCKNSHHSHDTEEVFMIHSGEWQFTWGETGNDGQIVLRAGDTISLPANMFRGFENIGDEPGFMFSILGLNPNGSAGSVVWAPYVFDQAQQHGLVLLEDGRLIDTAAGIVLPTDCKVMQATTSEDVHRFDRLTTEDIEKCVVTTRELDTLPESNLSTLSGIVEKALIGVANPLEAIDQAPIGWAHGFQLRQIELESNAIVPLHTRAEEEVIIVHKGVLNVACAGQTIELGEGDLFTVPVASQRSYRNSGNELVKAWVIRRGDRPQAAQFSST